MPLQKVGISWPLGQCLVLGRSSNVYVVNMPEIFKNLLRCSLILSRWTKFMVSWRKNASSKIVNSTAPSINSFVDVHVKTYPTFLLILIFFPLLRIKNSISSILGGCPAILYSKHKQYLKLLMPKTDRYCYQKIQ